MKGLCNIVPTYLVCILCIIYIINISFLGERLREKERGGNDIIHTNQNSTLSNHYDRVVLHNPLYYDNMNDDMNNWDCLQIQ